jgi:hypothetical protein
MSIRPWRNAFLTVSIITNFQGRPYIVDFVTLQCISYFGHTWCNKQSWKKTNNSLYSFFLRFFFHFPLFSTLSLFLSFNTPRGIVACFHNYFNSILRPGSLLLSTPYAAGEGEVHFKSISSSQEVKQWSVYEQICYHRLHTAKHIL